jgi:rfaE bifunctional protein nucleotidyltransferase chain/domain
VSLKLAFRHGEVRNVSELADLPRPLVFTNGVFDILHRGHVEYLFDARKLGASLLVAVNSDDSTRLLGKGDNRPINREYDRAFLVASLSPVSAVVVFEEKTPLETLHSFRPEIYVKGGDYNVENLPETPLIRSWGGRALTLSFRTGYSTTSLIQRISG